VYYELLPQNQTINSEEYCSQLDRLKAAINKKRSELSNRHGVVFHQDTRSHVSLTTWQKLLQFGWVLPHSLYSPDIAPSDFHLFRSLQNSLIGKNFTSFLEDCKKHLEEFFAYKTRKFWEDGNFKLPERWRKVVEKNGEYIIE